MEVKFRFINKDGATLSEVDKGILELDKYPRYHLTEGIPEGAYAVIVTVDGRKKDE